jgi:hypothetical protein
VMFGLVLVLLALPASRAVAIHWAHRTPMRAAPYARFGAKVKATLVSRGFTGGCVTTEYEPTGSRRAFYLLKSGMKLHCAQKIGPPTV